MTGSSFNGEIWSIVDLGSDKPKWIKADSTIPDPESDDPMFVTDTGMSTLFVGSPKLGVAKIAINF